MWACVCVSVRCSLVTRRGRARGGGMRELQGGAVGEKDRVLEESTSSMHTVTHSLAHTRV